MSDILKVIFGKIRYIDVEYEYIKEIESIFEHAECLTVLAKNMGIKYDPKPFINNRMNKADKRKIKLLKLIELRNKLL